MARLDDDDDEPSSYTRATVLLHGELRELLVDHFARAEAQMLATALAYEVASIIAADVSSEVRACELLRSVYETQIKQVLRFGVGKPHP